MAAVETAGRWTDLIDGVGLEIAEVFDQGQEEYIPGLDRVVKLVRGTGGKQNVTGKTGIGRLGRFDDGDDLPGGNRFKTYTTEITYSSYGVFVDVTKRAIEDRTFAAELDEMKDLSMGANFSQDESAMQVFAGGSADSGSAIDRKGYRITGYGDGEELTDSSLTLKNVLNNLRNCGEVLKRIIRSQAKKLEGSETIMQASFGMMG